MTETNLYNVGYDVGFEDGFKEAQARIKALEAQIQELHYGVTAAHFQGYIQGVQAAEAKLTGGRMSDEPDNYEILLEGYEAALGNDLSALQARIEELEAKLAKAVEAFDCWANLMENPAYGIAEMVAEFDDIVFNTRAEIIGGKDE